LRDQNSVAFMIPITIASIKTVLTGLDIYNYST